MLRTLILRLQLYQPTLFATQALNLLKTLKPSLILLLFLPSASFLPLLNNRLLTERKERERESCWGFSSASLLQSQTPPHPPCPSPTIPPVSQRGSVIIITAVIRSRSSPTTSLTTSPAPHGPFDHGAASACRPSSVVRAPTFETLRLLAGLTALAPSDGHPGGFRSSRPDA